jgi:Transposase, Mutator family
MKEQLMSDEKPMGQVIQIDEARIRDHLGELVRGTVEETLDAMLDAEADQLCGAGRYERSQARQDTRAGSYERTLQDLNEAGQFVRVIQDRTGLLLRVTCPEEIAYRRGFIDRATFARPVELVPASNYRTYLRRVLDDQFLAAH